jgi:hypothetical protein
LVKLEFVRRDGTNAGVLVMLEAKNVPFRT